MKKQKFSFSTEFQKEILRYLIKSSEGGLAMSRLKPSYLTLIEHQLIADGLYKFHRKHKRIPSEAVLKEDIRELLTNKTYSELIMSEDLPNIYNIISELYKGNLRDEDIIKDKIWKFSTYVEMKSLNEMFDLEDFAQYEHYNKKIAEILRKGNPRKEEEPLYMVEGIIERQLQRQSNPNVIPCPFKQLNKLTNGFGYPAGSVIVLLDRAKARKTFFMVNFARGYLKQKKSVLYLDLENGKGQIMDRLIQSTLNKTKKEMLSGDFDEAEKKHIRKYKRLGVEFIVERMVAGVSDANNIKELIKNIETTRGIKIKVLVIDYAGKLAAISKTKDDFARINEVYVEIQDLAFELGLDVVITAQHVTRDASERKATRYEESDIAGSIGIIRNAQVIIGLNSTDDEETNNIQRLEVVVQRDGPPHGRALFNVDVEKQRAIEFTEEQRKAYDRDVMPTLEKELSKKFNRKGKKNPNAKPINKEARGDI